MNPAELAVDKATGSTQRIVSSAEFVRQFGQLRQQRHDQPIVVTHHGRPTHVLLSAARYDEIRPGCTPVLPTLPSVCEFAECIPNGVFVLDSDMTILVANRVAHALVDRAGVGLVGRHVFEAMPELKGSLVETCVNRAMRGKEPCSAEVPSLFRPGAWVRVAVHPSAHHATIVFHDITEDVQRNRLADAKKAIRDAIAVHAGISYVRVNTRGMIEQADSSFYRRMALSEERLRHVALSSLIPITHRVAFREALDMAMSGKGPCSLESQLLSNDGTALPVSVTIAELRGLYGNEGAVLLLTAH